MESQNAEVVIIKRFPQTRPGLGLIATCLGATLLTAGLTGCENNNEDDYKDHVPPGGQGSLVVDNQTEDDIQVHSDGMDVGRVHDHESITVDLAPGLHQVVIAEYYHGYRNWTESVNVLAGHLTVLRVHWSLYNYDDYFVDIDINE